MSSKLSAWVRAAGIAAAASLAVACGDSGEPKEPSERIKPPETIPTTIALSATTMVSGFARGALRESVALRKFSITQHPITRAQYAECVDAGACADEREDGCDEGANELIRGRALDKPDSPQACLRIREAQGYCKWIGGRLPTLPEWLLAARGGSPQRHAWGEAPATSEQHPRAAEMPGAFPSEEKAQEAGCVPAADAPLVVAEHSAGASAAGLQDVLLTPGELLASQKDAQFSACGTGFEGCMVYGGTPGAIEAVYQINKPMASAPQAARTPHVYGFRCVLKEGN